MCEAKIEGENDMMVLRMNVYTRGCDRITAFQFSRIQRNNRSKRQQSEM